MDQNSLWQRLAAEFLGTAFLVFVGVGSVPATLILNNGKLGMADLGVISLAFGTIVLATVYVFGYIGGNHINPAVTVALAVNKLFPWKEVPAYILAQVLGAVVGAFAIVATLGQKASTVGLGIAAYSGISAWQAFAAEFIGTFVLVFTVLGVVYRKAAPGFAGVAIGLVVFAAIIPVAPATGAAINPARVTGPMIVQSLLGGTVHWEQWPVYVAAEILAGAVAAIAFALIARTPADRAAEAAADEPAVAATA